MLKKRLPGSSEKTKKYLESLRTVYLVACWAKYGVRAYKFSGKFKKDKVSGELIPLVYDYDDFNGACDYYWLRPLTHVTTGFITGWTFSQEIAEASVQVFNANFNANLKKWFAQQLEE